MGKTLDSGAAVRKNQNIPDDASSNQQLTADFRLRDFRCIQIPSARIAVRSSNERKTSGTRSDR
jgi:hypothetical protein